MFLQRRRRPVRRHAGVEADRIDPGLAGVGFVEHTGGAGKADDPNPGRMRLQPANDGGGGSDDQVAELRLRQQPGPAVEQLHHLDAMIDLPAKAMADGIDQDRDQPGEAFRLPPGPGPRPLAVGPALAFDHVERQRPGRPGEADQRGVGWDRLRQPGHRRVDRRQPLIQPLWVEGRNLLGPQQPFQHRALTLDEAHGAAQGVRDDQDVAEQDSRVHSIPAQRLQRRLDAKCRCIAEAEEVRGPPAQPLVLGEIAPGLAEEPERRPIRRLVGKGAQQALAQRTVLPGCVFNRRSDAHIKTLLLREKVAVVVGPWKAGD